MQKIALDFEVPEVFVFNGFASPWLTTFNTIDNQINVVSEIGFTVSPEDIFITPDGTKGYITRTDNGPLVFSTLTKKIIGTISGFLATRSVGGAFSPDGSKLYVAANNGVTGYIYVVDVKTSTVISAITNPSITSPGSLVITPDGTRLYVLNAPTNSVLVIDTLTHALITTITVSTPVDIAITPDGGYVYVVNGSGNAIVTINTTTNTIQLTSNNPFGITNQLNQIVITPDGSKAYVLGRAGATNDRIGVFDIVGNATIGIVTDAMSVLNNGQKMVVTPSSDTLYVTLSNPDNKVLIVDTNLNQIVGSVGDPFSYFFGCRDIAITPGGKPLEILYDTIQEVNQCCTTIDSKVDVVQASCETINSKIDVLLNSFVIPYAYVGNQTGNTLSVIRTDLNMELNEIPLTVSPRIITFTPNGLKAFVGNNVQTVNVVNTPIGKVGASFNIPGGSFLRCLTVTPDGSKLYAIDFNTNLISRYNVATNSYLGNVSGSFNGPVCMSISTTGARAYVTNLNISTVSIIDTASDTVVNTATGGSLNQPVEIATSPLGNKVYIGNNAGGNISVLNVATETMGTPINLTATSVGNIVFTPNGQKAYALLLNPANTIRVINALTDTVLGTVADPQSTFVNVVSIAMSKDGSKVYAVNQSNSTVSVIDTQTDRVVELVSGTFNSSYPVGFMPSYVSGNILNPLLAYLGVLNP